MSKQRIENYIPKAYEALNDPRIEIIQAEAINEKFRSQIASFGAAVSMGSFKSAVAFFSEKGGADVARQELMKAIFVIVYPDDNAALNERSLLNKIINLSDTDLDIAKGKIMDAAVALKLAMNAFNIIKDKGGDNSDGKTKKDTKQKSETEQLPGAE